MMKIFINAFLILLFTASIGACNPFKVTDPADPQFNLEKFRFEDYPGIPPMRDALQKLFPVGTPREKVEHILVDVGGATLNTIISAEQIQKNNASAQRDFPNHAREMFMLVRDYHIYTQTPDYWFPTIGIPQRVWNVGVQYDEQNNLLTLQLNGHLLNGVINYEELK